MLPKYVKRLKHFKSLKVRLQVHDFVLYLLCAPCSPSYSSLLGHIYKTEHFILKQRISPSGYLKISDFGPISFLLKIELTPLKSNVLRYMEHCKEIKKEA